MTQYKPILGSRTPECKLSPLNLLSDYDHFGVSHYSDIDAYYDDDYISGTMEGLVNDNLYDSAHLVATDAKNLSNENRSTKEDENTSKALLDHQIDEQPQTSE